MTVDRSSANGALYGLMLGGLSSALNGFDWTPLWVLFWGYNAAMTGVAAILTWRRTRMLWMSFGMAYASIWLGVGGWLYAGGGTFRTIAERSVVLYVVSVAALPAFLLMSRLLEADRWKQWRAQSGGVRFRDMFLFRHIPDLRSERV
jgi:hypothetical protein